ncbi:neural regeneration protein [Mus musculus]|uniref:AlkB homolog 1, histone H2A dioxygenase n=1 Tax=Mus musculus TaxID=10090 RepID=Q5XLJ1_MOUSE|nr:neural regeneration protein [Mus musculus]AAI19400.1 Neural regeneration protein [Mus musculus]AAI19402.1 Neural regeneration protein [Mus musculus]AAU93563.1 neural regeneration protein [Mus musculus]|eukprot:NP_001013390.1 neural regeneration protein [Mus musculus]
MNRNPGVVTPEEPARAGISSSASGPNCWQPRDGEDGGCCGFISHAGCRAQRGCFPEAFPLLPAEPAGDSGPGSRHRLLRGALGSEPEARRAPGRKGGVVCASLAADWATRDWAASGPALEGSPCWACPVSCNVER